ncbi:MAG: protein kinase, partial [Acidobacteriia bacterium]|nr:protein kinase [Terriglobia bacterium]
MPESTTPITPLIEPPAKSVIPPTPGEVITSTLTNCSYIIGEKIGEGSFGVVYGCVDDWNNDLAAKILKPKRSYEEVKASGIAEMQKLFLLRHPHITYFFDAFEYRDTFYIITERCRYSLADFFTMDWFEGHLWISPLARCLLQAVHFIHLNGLVHQDIHAGNVFALSARNEMDPGDHGATQFRLGDLGVAKLLSEIDPANTRAPWMLPPEVIDQSEFGALDHRIDIYHCGLLFLQLAHSKELRFTTEEIKAGKPRQMALQLPAPLNFALEKALRRHVSKRTESAKELWRDLNSPTQPAQGEAE